MKHISNAVLSSVTLGFKWAMVQYIIDYDLHQLRYPQTHLMFLYALKDIDS